MKALLFTALSVLLAEPPATAKPDTQWFQDARFGMFIHFGLYSIPAGGWNGQRKATVAGTEGGPGVSAADAGRVGRLLTETAPGWPKSRRVK